jgi:hypothetical protein
MAGTDRARDGLAPKATGARSPIPNQRQINSGRLRVMPPPADMLIVAIFPRRGKSVG